MPADEKRKNLGRGLSALLGEDSQDYAQLDKLRVSKLVPIEFIRPGRFQPRHKMDEEPIKELAQSIAEKGILQPILVRRDAGQPDSYEIIAGERRWRAGQLAGLHEVPVIVKDLSDSEALEIALVENLQRQDLSPLEEAEGYRRLMDEFAHTQEQLAKTVGKSRSHVANMMRLLGLPDPVKQFLEAGELTAGHARALLNAPNPIDLAKQIVRRGLNVRQAEHLAQAKPGKPKTPAAAPKKDADTLALERDLTTLLGLKVEIKFHAGGGVLAIHYGSLDQLDDILQRLSHGGSAGGAHRTIQTAPLGKPEEAFEIAAMAPESPKAAPTPAAKPGPAKKPPPAPARKVAVAVKATDPKASKTAQAKSAEKKITPAKPPRPAVRIHRAEPAAAATLAGAAALASVVGQKSEAAEPMPTLDENVVPDDYGLLDDSGTPVGDDGLSAGTDYVAAEPAPMPALDENAVADDYGLLEDSGSALADADAPAGYEPEPMPALDDNPAFADHAWVEDSDATTTTPDAGAVSPADDQELPSPFDELATESETVLGAASSGPSAEAAAVEFPEVPRREPIPPRLLVERPRKDDDGHPLDAPIPAPKIEPVRGKAALAQGGGRTELTDASSEDWVRQATRGELDLDEED